MINSEIIGLYNALQKISLDNSLKFDATTCFKMAKNKRALEPIVESIIEARRILFNKYKAPKDKEDPEIFIPKEKVPAFQEEYFDLLNTKVQIELEKISLNSFKDIKLEMELVENLMPMIE